MGGRLKLGQILVNRGLLHPDQLAAALADQRATGVKLGNTLIRRGFVDEETLIRTLAGQLKLPVARIRGKRVSPEVLECIPGDLAEKHRCLPLFFKQEGGEQLLYLAIEDPSDAEALAELAHASGQRLRAVLVGPTELEEALQRHYHWASLTGESPDWDAARSPLAPPGSAERDEDPEREEDAEALEALEPDAGSRSGPRFDPDALVDPPGTANAPGELAEALWADDLGAADTAPDFPDPDAAEHELDLEGLYEAERSADPREGWQGREAAAQRGEAERSAGTREADLDLDAPEPQPTRAPTRALRPESLDPRVILRALSQLLVEKGVITRDEFVQRLGEIAARESGD